MVIVVGAGPAGATAARTLAQAGIAVTLLDRAAFPRNKPCGGALSIRVLTRFPWLEPELASIASHRIARLYLEGPDGDSAVVTSDEPAVLMIRRVEFDALLVRQAQAAGATLVPNADVVRARMSDDQVTLESRDGRRFEAPVVIAADGVHSIVARRLGLNPGWDAGAVALDMMEETPASRLSADPSTLWVSYGYSGTSPGRRRAAAEGYAYIFPKREHVNVGIGYVLDHFKRDVHRQPYDLQRTFIDDLRRRGIVSGGSVRANFTPFIIPVGGPLRHPGRGRVLLAGDAGGFVNGFTAEGIYYAMVTGELAARAVLDVPATEVPRRLEAHYRRRWRAEIGSELRDSVLVRRHLFADRRRIARVLAAASADRRLTGLVLDYAIGRQPYAAVRRKVLGSAPLVACSLFMQFVRATLLPKWPAIGTMAAPRNRP